MLYGEGTLTTSRAGHYVVACLMQCTPINSLHAVCSRGMYNVLSLCMSCICSIYLAYCLSAAFGEFIAHLLHILLRLLVERGAVSPVLLGLMSADIRFL